MAKREPNNGRQRTKWWPTDYTTMVNGEPIQQRSAENPTIVSTWNRTAARLTLAAASQEKKDFAWQQRWKVCQKHWNTGHRALYSMGGQKFGRDIWTDLITTILPYNVKNTLCWTARRQNCSTWANMWTEKPSAYQLLGDKGGNVISSEFIFSPRYTHHGARMEKSESRAETTYNLRTHIFFQSRKTRHTRT